MKKLIFFTFISLLFFSCSKDDELSNKRQRPNIIANKTIFMYLPWTGGNYDSGLYSAFMKNISNVEKAIVAKQSYQATRTLVLIANSASSATLFEIIYDKGECWRDTLKQYTISETNEKSLTQYLADVKHFSPTPVYSMIMGAHGTGWIPKGTKLNRSRSIGGISAARQYNITEITNAIANNGIKLEFLCFDDCYMANIEVAYELRQATNYIIASTSEIMDYGLPYHLVYQYMAEQSPDYNAIINGFLSFYATYSAPYGSLSVIDCAYSNDIAAVLKKFNSSSATPPTADEVAGQDVFANHLFYDLGDYLKRYNAQITSIGQDTIEYSQIIKHLIPFTGKTEKLYSAFLDAPYTYNVSAYSGITISDPSVNAAAIENKNKTNWWIATHQ